MEKQGYKKPMSLGPILGSGGLAIMIRQALWPFFLGDREISIGKILVAIIVPGWCWPASMRPISCSVIMQPALAPAYVWLTFRCRKKSEPPSIRFCPRAVVFLVVGVIILGIATPSEAAATVLSEHSSSPHSPANELGCREKSRDGNCFMTGMLFMIMSAPRLQPGSGGQRGDSGPLRTGDRPFTAGHCWSSS
jgi:hypothetical protein